MLSDIGHEQQVQERLRLYEMDMKKKPAAYEDPNVQIHHVEPLNLDDIDWGDDEKKDVKKTDGEKKKDGVKKEEKKVEDSQKEEKKSADEEIKHPEEDGDSGVDLRVEL
eukprot:XP_003727607.1 PREDICTED: synaptic vesicle membrane protein VAT-1 homolog [Strongylocentrotus purpuratus]